MYNALHHGATVYQAFIGETISVVYLPVFLNNGLHDAVTGRRIASIPPGIIDREGAIDHGDEIGVQFLPSLCPQCGWNLDLEHDSLVMLCRNCRSAWQASERTLERLEFEVLESSFDACLFLPFWRIRPQISGLQLDSYADLIRFGNLPKIVKREWERRDLFLWTPAFKVNPHAYLRIAKTVTIVQPPADGSEGLPKDRFHPVTLPPAESEESLRILLADFARPKQQLFPRLEQITAEARETRLIFVPFRDGGREIHNSDLRLCIPSNLLKYGKNL
jgi:hypothetical protein